MRSILTSLALVTALTACGPHRTGTLDPSSGTTGAQPAALQQVWHALDEAERAPAPSESSLGCVSHPAIDAWEDRLRAGGAAWTSTIDGVARGAQYLDRMRSILVEEGVPPSLALLPVMESSFHPEAHAPDGGRGLWQLSAHTARRFGLVVSKRRDDRIDPEQSTRAAARYLRMLYVHYGDWPLTLAAYNAGEGRVDRALSRVAGSTFWDAEPHLPRTSRDYVPHFLAVVRVVAAEPGC